MSPHRRSPILTAVTGMVVALLVTACGSPVASHTPAEASPAVASSSVASSPAATDATSVPQPIPTPNPTATVDVSKPFLAILTSPTFSAEMSLKGTVRVNGISYPISGTASVNGPDHVDSMTIGYTTAPQTSRSMTVGGVTYLDRSGRWFEKPATAGPTTGGLSAALKAILGVVDVGVTTRDGRPLHHLAPPAGTLIPVSALGIADGSAKGTVTIDFYATEAGTPVAMVIAASWAQTSGSISEPVDMQVEYEFSQIGSQLVITAPSDVWTTHTSKSFGYTMAYPSDWEVKASKNKRRSDLYLNADDTVVLAGSVTIGGTSLNTEVSHFVADEKQHFKATVSSNTPAKLGGLRARRVVYTEVYKGQREWDVAVFAVRGNKLWILGYSSFTKLTEDDLETFGTFVETFTFPGATAGPGATGIAAQAG